jgi:hypothetical protein
MHEKRNGTDRRNRPGLPVMPGWGGDLGAALALGRQVTRPRGRMRHVSRRPPGDAAGAAPAGARTSRPRVRGERAAAAAARAGRGGSGPGRADSPAQRCGTGWGWKTNAMRLRMRCRRRPPAPAGPTGPDAPDGFGKLLSPACTDFCRAVHVPLLFHVLAVDRRATSWSPACRGAYALHHLLAGALAGSGAAFVPWMSGLREPARETPG